MCIHVFSFTKRLKVSSSYSNILNVQLAPRQDSLKWVATELIGLTRLMSPLCCNNLMWSLFLVWPTYILLEFLHSIPYTRPDDLQFPGFV